MVSFVSEMQEVTSLSPRNKKLHKTQSVVANFMDNVIELLKNIQLFSLFYEIQMLPVSESKCLSISEVI